MRSAVLLGRGPRLFLVTLPDGAVEGFPWDVAPERAAERAAAHGAEHLPTGLRARLGSLGTDLGLLSGEPGLGPVVARELGRAVGEATLTELRSARARLPELAEDEERAFVRALARLRLEQALRSPDEVLVTLAREEIRVERSVGREARAAEAFVAVPGTPLEPYAREWHRIRESLEQHHASLRGEVERRARALLPNLSELVGPLVAARLLAVAGEAGTLARLRGPRLQLLGSRRRPSAERGPRYGVLYRADRMEELPLGRRGAYARSLASLAAIAIRADVLTHRDLTTTLVGRRDRRVRELQRRRP